MAINLGISYPISAGTVVRSAINSILAAIVSKFNANIDNSDISSTANISPTKLSASNTECWVTLPYLERGTVWPAVSATTPLVAAALPGQSGDASWVATDVSWVCNDIGTADASFDVRYGHYDGTGAWTNDGSVTLGVVLTRIGGDGTGSQGRSSRLSVSIPNGATVTSLALMSAGAGTGVVSAATGFLVVSVRLRRVLQSI